MNIPALLFDLSLTLGRFSPGRCVTVVGLMLFRSLTAGFSLILIIPFLHMIGIHSNTASNPLANHLATLFAWLHLSLCLENILLLFLIMATCIALAQMLDEIIRNQWQESYMHHLRQLLYSKLLDTHWEFFIKNKHSDLLHGITAQLQSSWQCHFQWLQILNQSILLLVYIVLDFMISWQVTLIACGFGLFLLSLMRPLHRLTVSRGIYGLKRHQALFQVFYEQFNVFKMVKSSHQEPVLLKRILDESLSMQEQSKHYTLIRAGSKALFNVISAFAFIALIYLSLTKLALSLDAFFILIMTFSRILSMLSSTQQNYQQLLGQLPMYAHLKDLLSLCQKNQEIRGAACSIQFQRSIAFETVAFHYAENQSWVFQSLSFTLKKNTTTVIIGPSGVGKTTLVDLIIGLLRPTTGRIKIDDITLENQHLSAWRKKIVYVPQDIFLFHASIRNNLVMFCAQVPSEEKIWNTLKIVSADQFVRALPQGLETVVGERGIYLSGGERQRIALARAILMQPELLILDESTNALDDLTIDTIQKSLQYLHKKMTILIISHQWKMQSFADTILDLSPAALPLNKDLTCIN